MQLLRLMIRPLRHYADFEGTSSLKEFWAFFLTTILLAIPFVIGDAFVRRGFPVSEPIQLALTIVLWFPNCALYVRRLHSLGLSGWWLFTGIGFFFLALLSNATVGHFSWGRYLTSAFTIAVGLNLLIVVALATFVPARIIDR